MNRDEILNELYNLNLDKNRCVIISGAALVLRGIIDETSDIDIACDIEYYNNLNWKTCIGAIGKEIKTYKCFDISNNFYDNNMEYDLIEGYRLMTLKDILKVKKLLNREKDRNVIKKLEQITSC